MTLPSKFAREFELPVGVMPLGPQLDKRKFSGGGAIPLGNAWRRCALGMPPLVGSRCTPPGLERSLRLTSSFPAGLVEAAHSLGDPPRRRVRSGGRPAIVTVNGAQA